MGEQVKRIARELMYEGAILKVYKDTMKFANMSLVNTAKAGIFSADRAVKEYADNIWHAEQIKD